MKPASRLALAWLVGSLIAVVSAPALALPERGWWWNPAETGRGYFLEAQASRMFMAGYFYDADGRATWLVSNDPMPEPDRYDGRLLAFRGGQTLFGDYRSPSGPADAGAVSLRFLDDTHAMLTWPGGTISIERQGFRHGDDAQFEPHTGWWWNPEESGRGFSIETQGDHIFIGAYMYDEAGNPVWYVADGLMQSPTRYSGPLLRFANGQALAGTYRAPGPPATVGGLTVEFTDAKKATVTLSEDAASTLKVRPKIINIEPQLVPRTVPQKWLGGLGWESVVEFSFDGSKSDITLIAPRVEWYLKSAGPDAGYPAHYGSREARPPSHAIVDWKDTSPSCTFIGTAPVEWDHRFSTLIVEKDGSYKGLLPAKTLRVHGINTCGSAREEIRQTSFLFDFAGTLVQGAMQQYPPTPADSLEDESILKCWKFVPDPPPKISQPKDESVIGTFCH